MSAIAAPSLKSLEKQLAKANNRVAKAKDAVKTAKEKHANELDAVRVIKEQIKAAKGKTDEAE